MFPPHSGRAGSLLQAAPAPGARSCWLRGLWDFAGLFPWAPCQVPLCSGHRVIRQLLSDGQELPSCQPGEVQEVVAQKRQHVHAAGWGTRSSPSVLAQQTALPKTGTVRLSFCFWSGLLSSQAPAVVSATGGGGTVPLCCSSVTSRDVSVSPCPRRGSSLRADLGVRLERGLLCLPVPLKSRT